MVNPVAGYGITTPYKKYGPYWSLGWHTGVDISGTGVAGKPIVSATPGRVIAANAWDRAYGYKVIIRWGGYDVWYCHMPSGAARVRVGQTVTAGQRLGSVGSTGNVTGPHLHMELRVAGGSFAAANFRNPQTAIDYRPPTVFKPTAYYVTVPRLTAHASPSVGSRTLPYPVSYGRKLTIRGLKVVYGTTWGWTLRPTGKAWWILEGRTSKTVPPPLPVEPKPVAKIVVGSYNLAAQASGHNETWRPKRAALTVANMVDSAADVVLAQETGSSIYLDALDKELGDADTDLIRVNGGSNWRHILRRTTRTKFIAAKTVTLKYDSREPIGTDSDGSQVAMAALEIASVHASFASLHFDVGATDEMHRRQAEKAYAELAAFSREHKVDPLNWTIGGDTNDRNGVVDKVMRSHGLAPMATDAPIHHQADKKTTNGWKDAWVKGARIDNIYVPIGASISWNQQLDAEASNHNLQFGTRRLFAT